MRNRERATAARVIGAAAAVCSFGLWAQPAQAQFDNLAAAPNPLPGLFEDYIAPNCSDAESCANLVAASPVQFSDAASLEAAVALRAREAWEQHRVWNHLYGTFCASLTACPVFDGTPLMGERAEHVDAQPGIIMEKRPVEWGFASHIWGAAKQPLLTEADWVAAGVPTAIASAAWANASEWPQESRRINSVTTRIATGGSPQIIELHETLHLDPPAPMLDINSGFGSEGLWLPDIELNGIFNERYFALFAEQNYWPRVEFASDRYDNGMLQSPNIRFVRAADFDGTCGVQVGKGTYSGFRVDGFPVGICAEEESILIGVQAWNNDVGIQTEGVVAQSVLVGNDVGIHGRKMLVVESALIANDVGVESEAAYMPKGGSWYNTTFSEDVYDETLFGGPPHAKNGLPVVMTYTADLYLDDDNNTHPGWSVEGTLDFGANPYDDTVTLLYFTSYSGNEPSTVLATQTIHAGPGGGLQPFSTFLLESEGFSAGDRVGVMVYNGQWGGWFANLKQTDSWEVRERYYQSAMWAFLEQTGDGWNSVLPSDPSQPVVLPETQSVEFRAPRAPRGPQAPWAPKGR